MAGQPIMSSENDKVAKYVSDLLNEAIAGLEVAEIQLKELKKARTLMSIGAWRKATDIIAMSHAPLECLIDLQDVLCRATKAGEEL